jgi:outer membrane receptor protein involved in Fe transport
MKRNTSFSIIVAITIIVLSFTIFSTTRLPAQQPQRVERTERAERVGSLLTGTVTDKETAAPLGGVSVKIKGTLSGGLTNAQGAFSFSTQQPFPLTLVFSRLGYAKVERIVTSAVASAQEAASESSLNVQLKAGVSIGDEIVVSASKVEESVAKSPVAIEKLDILAIKSTPAASFFDAIESIKGVQMTTLSLGFKVPNTRGFANTTNARFLELVDGADMQAPGLGVSIGNTVGPTELDVESIEIVPGASSALYGMNALNGVANITTKNPFWSQGLSFYQRTGVNHVDGKDHKPALFTESAVRFATALTDKIAFKINAGLFQGTDWVASSDLELNPNANASTGLLGLDNPARDPINSYGNENGNRRTLTLDGKRYEVRRTGYWEKDLVTDDYRVRNAKVDASLHYKVTEEIEAAYTYRLGTTDAIYQRGNRIRLTDYQIQQHKLDIRGTDFFVKGYWTLERTDKSYNIRPIGENVDKAFKSDDKWFADYTAAFNAANTLPLADRHRAARTATDAGRLQPGTPEFDAKLRELSLINNWDIGGQLIMQNQFYQIEAQYDLSRIIQTALQAVVPALDVLVGGNYRDFIIKPEGNSFRNPDVNDPFKIINYSNFGFFAQVAKRLLDDKLKLVASARVDKTQYFDAKVNPRLAAVYTLEENHNFRASYQNGYRFPTLFEGFSTVNNNGIIRYGGLDILTQPLQLFENSYVRSTVDKFQTAVNADINKGKARNQAIVDNRGLLVRNEYTYLQPEEVNAVDVGYKGTFLDGRLFIDADAYYNIYSNFIDQIEIAVPKEGKIGQNVVDGVDATVYEIEDLKRQTRYRMWTNSKSKYYNYGGSLGISFAAIDRYTFAANVSYAELQKIDRRDVGLETSFNTPKWIVNVSVSNRQVTGAENLGFSVAYRWQSEFVWYSQLGNGTVPAYGTVDAQVSYKIPALKLTTKLGASNLLNTRYFQYAGGPTVGGMYYLALTFDDVLSGL